MELKVSRKSIDAFFSRLKEGTRYTCLDNTFREAAIGTSGVVVRPGKTTFSFKFDDGRVAWFNVPKRVSDVVRITEDTITYHIGNDHHTATWKIEELFDHNEATAYEVDEEGNPVD